MNLVRGIVLIVGCLAASARAQVIVSGPGQPTDPGYTWYVDVTTGERTILFEGMFSALGVDDAGGRVFAASTSSSQLRVWTYGSTNPPQILGNVHTPTIPVRIDALAYGGGRLFASSTLGTNFPGIYEIDPTTLLATQLAIVANAFPEGLCFNAADGMFYGVIDAALSSAPGLYRYDLLGTLAVTQVASMPPFGPSDIDGLAVGNGRAYLVGDDQSAIAEWDFATSTYIASGIHCGLTNEGLVSGADWAASLSVQGRPRIYCDGKVNSQNCLPYLSWIGEASASHATNFVVRAGRLRIGVMGALCYSTAGSASTPFGGGTLCVAAPTKRTYVSQSFGDPVACGGSIIFDFGDQISSGLDPALVAGQTVWIQFVSRDPGFAQPDNMGLSPALRATIQP